MYPEKLRRTKTRSEGRGRVGVDQGCVVTCTLGRRRDRGKTGRPSLLPLLVSPFFPLYLLPFSLLRFPFPNLSSEGGGAASRPLGGRRRGERRQTGTRSGPTLTTLSLLLFSPRPDWCHPVRGVRTVSGVGRQGRGHSLRSVRGEIPSGGTVLGVYGLSV